MLIYRFINLLIKRNTQKIHQLMTQGYFMAKTTFVEEVAFRIYLRLASKAMPNRE